MPPKSTTQTSPHEQSGVGPFQPDRLYRYADLRHAGLTESWNTLKNWQKGFDFPSGRLVGHCRVWTGSELNAWFATRPTARLDKNRPDKSTAATEETAA